MAELTEHIQSGDWKAEKHVPIIDAPDSVKAGEFFPVKATLGKAVAHPNTTEHHIVWMDLYYLPEGGHYLFQVGRFEFGAHGQDPGGPNKGPVYTHHEAATSMKITKPGTLYAMAMCNIHGLWKASKPIKLA